jgi:signal transduction histidine kinase
VLDQLQQTRQQLIRSEQLAAVGQLAAGVAHELRNPLTSVKLLIQMAARRGPKTGLTEKQLWVIQEEIARMENTIQGLLDFARPPVLDRIRHDLRETVQRAVSLVEGRAKQQKVTVRPQLPEAAVMVDGDPAQIHQVFVNLLLNGIDSAGRGGLLHVIVSESGVAGGGCRIAFRDSGRGIPEEALQELFEPFVTTKEQGMGLGLAISRRIVEEHGGTIIAANHAEGGAEFTVTLPTSAVEPQQPRAPQRPEAETS